MNNSHCFQDASLAEAVLRMLLSPQRVEISEIPVTSSANCLKQLLPDKVASCNGNGKQEMSLRWLLESCLGVLKANTGLREMRRCREELRFCLACPVISSPEYYRAVAFPEGCTLKPRPKTE